MNYPLCTLKAQKTKAVRLRGSSDGAPSPLTALSGVESGLAGSDVLVLGDLLGALGQDQLNVAGVAHVGVDAAVGAVGATALLGGLVDLDVFDDQVGRVESLGVGVGFGVLQQIEQELGGLDWVAGA
jgi:hypothetical protein